MSDDVERQRMLAENIIMALPAHLTLDRRGGPEMYRDLKYASSYVMAGRRDVRIRDDSMVPVFCEILCGSSEEGR